MAQSLFWINIMMLFSFANVGFGHRVKPRLVESIPMDLDTNNKKYIYVFFVGIALS
jgi:hypothetical protein